MIFLMCNGGITYYIDLEPNRVGQPDVRYELTGDFDLVGQLHSLAVLDAVHPDHEVRGVYSFEVEAKAAAHGDGARSCVIVWPARGFRVTEPLPRPKKSSQEVDEDIDPEEEEQITEDILASKAEEYLSESSAVADTDAEAVSSDGSSSSLSEDAPPVVLAKLPTVHGDGARSTETAHGRGARVKKPPLWDNGCFYIVNNTGHPDVKILMHSNWSHAPPGGMGSVGRSKTLTLSHCGEPRSDPTISLLLLRAWMLWRVNHKGWVVADRGRQRPFAEEAVRLEKQIKALSRKGQLLGHPKADALLKSWVPGIANSLCN